MGPQRTSAIRSSKRADLQRSEAQAAEGKFASGFHRPTGLGSTQIRGRSCERTCVDFMAFYSGCSLIVAIPQDYSKRDDLTQFLSSKLDGCEISVVEVPTAKEPFPEKVMIKEDFLRSLQGSDFATENTSELLLVAAGEAIHEFLKDSKE